MRDATPTMFGCPRFDPEQKYDVVFVGVPSDVGGLGHRSPAAAPAFLRSTSTLFPRLMDDAGRARGWFDYETRRTLLEGVRIADAGDFPCERGLGVAGLAPLTGVYGALRDATKLLVILGGDHSIAHFMAESLEDEGIVWLDAHEDAADPHGPYPDCANVVRYIDELASVRAVAQLGLRGIVPNNRVTPPPKRRLCGDVAEAVEHLRTHGVASAAVTIDVDVFDPSSLPAVGSPMPEGLASKDVLALFPALRAAGIGTPILEIVELAPVSESDVVSALFLLNFLLRATDLVVGAAP